MERFVERRACPVCGELRHDILRSAAFDAPEVWEFLARYYAGRIAPGDLAGGRFEVRRCHACRFLWQAFHLDEHGMGVLYEHWISAEESLAKKTRADVSLYDGYAREISAIARRLGRKPCQLSLLDFGMGWGAWCRMAQAYRLCRRGLRALAAAPAARAGLGHPRDRLARCPRALRLHQLPSRARARPRSARDPRAPGRRARAGRAGAPERSGRARDGARLQAPGWRAEKDALHPLEHLNCFTSDTLARLAARVGLRPAPEPALATPGLRAFARRAVARLRSSHEALPGTTHCFARVGDVAVCGILGQIESQAADRRGGVRAHARDAGRARARRLGHACPARGPRRARPSTARDPRSLRERRPADDERRRDALAHVQRRDLQLPRAAQAARGAGPPLPLGERLRGDPPRLRRVGRRLRAAAARDLRLRPLGRPPRAPAARARPPRREAPLLLGARGGPRLRFAAARDSRAPALPPRGRRARVPALPRLPLRAGRSRDLGGDEQAARRAPAGARSPRRAARPLLGGPLRPGRAQRAPRRRGWCATSSRKPCACSS